MAFVMDEEVTVQTSSPLAENDRKTSSGSRKGEEKNVAKDGSAGEGDGSVKGFRKPGQCFPKSNKILVMMVKLEGLESHI